MSAERCARCGGELTGDVPVRNILKIAGMGDMCLRCAKKEWTPKKDREVRERIAARIDRDDDTSEYSAIQRANGHLHRARAKHLPALWTPEFEAEMIAAWDNRCAYCGRHFDGKLHKLHIDHYIPLSKGFLCPGSVKWNLLPVCQSCNVSKSGRWPEFWIGNEFPDRADEILARIARYFKEVSPSKAERRAAARTHKQLSFDLD